MDIKQCVDNLKLINDRNKKQKFELLRQYACDVINTGVAREQDKDANPPKDNLITEDYNALTSAWGAVIDELKLGGYFTHGCTSKESIAKVLNLRKYDNGYYIAT